jgi:hypothetical protein
MSGRSHGSAEVMQNHARDIENFIVYAFDTTYDTSTWMRTSLRLPPHAVSPRCFCFRCAWRRKNQRFWESLPSGLGSMFRTPTDAGGDSDGSEHSSQIETQMSRSPPMNDDPYAMQNVFDASGEYLHSYVVPETFLPFEESASLTPFGGGPAEASRPGRLQNVRSRTDFEESASLNSFGGGPAEASRDTRPGRLQVVRSRMEMAPKLPQIPSAPLPPGERQAHDRLKPAFVTTFKNLHRFYDEKSRAVAIVSWKFCDAEEIWAICTCKLLGAGKQETMVAVFSSIHVMLHSSHTSAGVVSQVCHATRP